MALTEHSDSAPFVISKAAAGSGKTFTLVLEYLKIALAGPRDGIKYRFRGILAITFTNKAAGEMKSRIMNELDTMANEGVDPDDEKTFGAALLKEMAAMDYYRQSPPTPDDLQAMAAELQSAILHHYSDLSVFTIDSFMHRVVRTFAHDLGRPEQFDLMIDQKELVERLVGQLMSLVGTEGNEDLTRILMDYAESNMDSDKGYNVEVAIGEFAEHLFDEDIEQRLRSLSSLSMSDYGAIHKRLVSANRAVEQKLKDIGSEFLALVEPLGLEEADCFQGASGFFAYFRRLAKGVEKMKDAKPNSYVVTSMTGGKLVSTKCSKALAERMESYRPQMERIYGKVLQFFEHDYVDYNTRAMLLVNLYSTALLGRLYGLMADYSQEDSVLHISEFNRMINSIVEDEDNPAPFIFERLGNRYRHFLIDEFQDTSIMQWHNLVPLVENGVASRQESLVVGDAKQAIYRFRQGDVRQFVALPRVEGMRHHGVTLPLPGNSRMNPLDTNFRTAAAVVDFNNNFFSWLVRGPMADNELAQEIYIGRDENGALRAQGNEELRQRKSKSDEGHVCVSILDDSDKTRLYAEVKATVELLVGERGYNYRDIMLLARSNDDLADLSAWLTSNSDIPQTSSQSFLVASSDAAMALVAALRWVHNQRDRVAATELRQRLVNLGIAQPSDNADTQIPVSLDPDSLASLDLYDLCEELVRRLNLDGIDMPYIGKLLDAAAAFAARHRQQLGEFLDWIDNESDLSASTSDQLDAVQLLTVHKAKGLQKPVVICVFFPRSEKYPQMWVDLPHDSTVEGPQLPTAFVAFTKNTPTRLAEQCDNEMALNRVDELNVLYVALTRPEEQLYILCKKGNEGFPAQIEQYFLTPREEECRPHQMTTDTEGRIHIGKADWCKDDCEKKPRRKDEKTIQTLQRLTYADWTSRVSIASPSEKAATSLLEDHQRFGTYAHDLMSSIAYADDVEPAFEAFCKRYPLTDSEKAKFLHLAQMAVAHPDAQRFFAHGNRVVGELPIFDKGKECRPDRVVFAEGETWVVDFKTGAPSPQNISQVRDYCRRISAMGYPNVSGWLLYLHDDGVELVGV